ncbi:MAG: ADP-ribosylation factor-like protein [Candidatus Odinarchaeota archaeon]
MLKRFSVVKKGGSEIFTYEPEPVSDKLDDPVLLSGFLEALQMLSERIESPLEFVRFSNMMLHVRTYGDFTLRMIVDEIVDEKDLEEYFSQLVTGASLITGSDHAVDDSTMASFEQQVKTILAPLTDQRLTGTMEYLTGKKRASRIALVGLANAGKTTIKNLFFDNWSLEMASNVKATIGLEMTKKFQDFLKHQSVILDFGGQTTYRKQYLEKVDHWKGLSAVIFVVDVQARDTFDPALRYLKDVWKAVTGVSDRKPRLSIFFHKYDIDKRNNLAGNVSDCMMLFKEFVDQATFYLTTIDGAISNVALIKTLYLSLPETVIKRVLEEEFIEAFDGIILPGFATVVRGERPLEIFLKLKESIHLQAIQVGKNLALNLQRKWLEYLTGNRLPQRRLITARSLEVNQKGQSLLIKFQHRPFQDTPVELVTTLFGGMLEGALKTLELGNPVIVENTDMYTLWKVDI